jgi:transcriptional regulator GlxA family with amidase domain
MFRQAAQPKTSFLGRSESVSVMDSAPLRRAPDGTWLRSPASASLHLVDARVLAVLGDVAREPEKAHSAKSLAILVHLSPSRLEHLFRKETGLTIKAFLRATRMTRANQLLQDRTLRVKEVAAAVGYADHSNFAHDFRKRYGRPPSQTQ